MDKKIMAIGVVAIILVAAVAVFFVTKDKDDGGDGPTVKDNDLSIVGRVNTDGSGIFVKEGVDPTKYAEIVTEKPTSGYYFGENGKWVVFHKEAWQGAVFGDPGAATIQHVHLSMIADLLDLKFVQYAKGTQISQDTLYYIPGPGTYAKFVSELVNNPVMVGAFMWEPQVSVAVQAGCSIVAVTNDMFPGHTCCVIGAQHSYLTSHTDESIRFLAAYIESVEKMTATIKAGSGAEYDELIQIALDNVTMPLDMEREDKIAAIESAFSIVVYKYADTTENVADPLKDLKKDIAELATTFPVQHSYSDLGFSSAEAMADKFVQSQYIKDAMTYEKKDSYETAKITVAVIGGDIHQLAIHYGMETGVFEEYGIDITLSPQVHGPAVFTAMHNGSAQFGFIGAPPMTTNSMNQGVITPSS